MLTRTRSALTLSLFYGKLVLPSRRHRAPLAPEHPHTASHTHGSLTDSQSPASPAEWHGYGRGVAASPPILAVFAAALAIPCHFVAVSCRDLAAFATHNAECQVAGSRKVA